MKKSILAVLICLSLLVMPAGILKTEAASSDPQGQTQFVYRGTGKTEIDKGPGITTGGNKSEVRTRAAKTGDTTNIGNWLMALSGSVLILFLVGAAKHWKREDEEISSL